MASCDACGIPLADEDRHALTFAFSEPPLRTGLCGPCAQRLQADGIASPLPTPRFANPPVFHLPIVTGDDLEALRREVLRRLPPKDPALRELLAGSAWPDADGVAAFRDRITLRDPRPGIGELAGAILAAAAVPIELLPDTDLAGLVDRAESSDELELCHAAYCARLADARNWRADGAEPDGRTRSLLEAADRRFLLASLPSNHPLAAIATAMRAGVALALRRGPAADAAIARLPRDDARTRVLRALRLCWQDNFAGADRELRAAADDPLVGFDPAIGSAVVWNRAIRAIMATRWTEARDCLRDYCRMHPKDVVARFVLGHTWLRSSPAGVAREVFASVFDEKAVDVLRACIETGSVTPELRAEAAALYANCLIRLGDLREARSIVERELAQHDVPVEREAELRRTIAWIELADSRPAEALDHLLVAWQREHDREIAAEVAFATTATARQALEVDGLAGFLAFFDARADLRDALRRHHGSLHLFLTAAFALQQITGDHRPAHGFGMDWTWLRMRGADSQSSTFQAFAALARHQLALALQHDCVAQGAGAAAIPMNLLGMTMAASRRAAPELRAALVERLQRIIATLAVELRGATDGPAA